MGLLLAILSVILTYAFAPFLVVYNIIRAFVTKGFKGGYRYLDEYFRRVAVSVDVMGNTTGDQAWNDFWVKEDSYYPFGRLETISKVMGINDAINNLTKFGRIMGSALNFIDRDHLKKSVNEY